MSCGTSKSTCHIKYQAERAAIFQAINDGCSFHFNEDNVHTRLYSTVRWLVNNDPTFKQLDQTTDTTDTGFRQRVAANVRDAVLEYDDPAQGPRT